jgi:hypothetical protein
VTWLRHFLTRDSSERTWDALINFHLCSCGTKDSSWKKHVTLSKHVSWCLCRGITPTPYCDKTGNKSGKWYIQQYLTSRYSGVTSADWAWFHCFLYQHVNGRHVPVVVGDVPHLDEPLPIRGNLCLRLGMLGVVIFILGDLVLGIYMVFWCEPLPRNIYWSIVS